MAILGIDDTDSRDGGMCTTWIATKVARQLSVDVEECFLIRLNPAIEHKTRGNGAVAIRAPCDVAELVDIGQSVVDAFAVIDDPETNPGMVAVNSVDTVSADLRAFARDGVRSVHTRAKATALLEAVGAHVRTWGNERGIIGATAALGAVGCYHREDATDPVFGDWTYEWLAYRRPSRWGSARTVDLSDAHGRLDGRRERVWDTTDPRTGEAVCVPNSPCPVLYGLRGDQPGDVSEVADTIAGEPVARTRLFVTNQGTDGHLRPGTIGALRDGRSYRVAGTVSGPPRTRQGGHVVVDIVDDGRPLECLAFAPTGRFRDRVLSLVPGDRVIACGEVESGALKLEKFALVARSLTERRNPQCPACERSMESAGREQGYRCRSCRTSAPGKISVPRERNIEPGWYEVPPGARRHLAKPLVRGGYALPTHPTSV